MYMAIHGMRPAPGISARFSRLRQVAMSLFLLRAAFMLCLKGDTLGRHILEASRCAIPPCGVFMVKLIAFLWLTISTMTRGSMPPSIIGFYGNQLMWNNQQEG